MIGLPAYELSFLKLQIINWVKEWKIKSRGKMETTTIKKERKVKETDD